MPAPRVVSLIASATEITAALGREELLVGRSHECDYPASVQKLPVCSEPKLDVEGSSRQIDQRVKTLVEQGLSVYRVHSDLLQQLQPEVILTQDHCEVCAVSLKDVEQAVCDLVTGRPRVVSLAPKTLADVWQSIQQIAEALDVPHKGEQLVAELQDRMATLAATSQSLSHRPTVACIEWIDPLMAAGNWMPTLVETAGGRNIFGRADEHAPWMSWQEVVAADPEVLVAMPCGWDIAKCRQEMPALSTRPEWPRRQAVQNGRVYLTDGNQYFNRPGPRLVESAEILAEILHPETFNFGHEGTGWVRMND